MTHMLKKEKREREREREREYEYDAGSQNHAPHQA
jgi:hypothetical protein